MVTYSISNFLNLTPKLNYSQGSFKKVLLSFWWSVCKLMNLSFPNKPYLEDNRLLLVSNWKLLFTRLNSKSSSIVVMDTLKVTNLNWIRDQKSQLVRSEVNVQVKANIDLWSIVMIPGGFMWRLHPIYMTLGRGRYVVLLVNNEF